MPLPAILAGAGALLGAGSSYFGQASEIKKKKNQLNKLRAMLEDIKIDENERAEGLDKVGDAFNTGIMENLNLSGIGTALGGATNQNNFRASIGSKLLGQRAMAMLERDAEYDAYNRSIQERLAMSSLDDPGGINFGNVLSGAIQGGLAGGQLGMNMNEINTLKKTPIIPATPATPAIPVKSITSGTSLLQPNFLQDWKPSYLKPFPLEPFSLTKKKK